MYIRKDLDRTDLKELLNFQVDRESLWDGEFKIPWHEPDFSRRMLQEHLSQAHDMASRRSDIIETHVRWIHDTILQKRPSKLLDLGCGPGFYIEKLSLLGHQCTGVDFSPASVDYARCHCKESQIVLGDIRNTFFGDEYDLVMLLFGELNVFPPDDFQRILDKAYASLKQGGILLIEVSLLDAVKKSGCAPPRWYTSDKGGLYALFSDKPHGTLVENHWFEKPRVARSDFWIFEENSKNVSHYVSTTQGYTDSEYASLLKQSLFQDVTFHGNYGQDLTDASELQVISAVR